MTLYLKYRPQKIADLDLTAVRKMLKDIVLAKQLPHAFLFTGPRGVGKTSSARILAKAVNCESRVDGEPCGVCESCIAISGADSPDVIEIDAASNRGIDEIRILRDQVHLAPMRAKYKVYIIDEVHMLTTEAANALLKTLEEPPAHALFVLCTTEADRLLDTVVSRCIHVRFSTPSLTEIQEKLKLVAIGEGQSYSDSDLLLISRAGRGSFRDSIKILEQVIIAGGDVAGVLGIVEFARPEQFLELVRNGKAVEALDMVEMLVAKGISVRGFVEQLLSYLHEQILEKAKVATVSLANEYLLVEHLEQVYERSKYAAVAQLPLELFVLAFAKPKPIPVVEITKPVVMPKVEQPVVAKPLRTVTGLKLESFVEKWPDILKLVKAQNTSVEALLRSTKPVDFDGTTAELEVFYAFHKDKLESEKCRSLIEKAISDAFGGTVAKLKLSLGDKKVVKPDNIQGKVGDDIVAAAEAIFGVQAV